MKKKSVFFIHGSSSSSRIFEKLPHYNKNRFDFYAYDLPGHGGNSEKIVTIEDCSLQVYRDFLINKIKTIDGDKIVVGNSLGGHLAIEIANQIDGLKALVIFGTPPVKSPINFEEAFVSIPEFNVFLTENPSDAEIKNAANVTVYNNKNASLIVDEFKKSNPLVRKAIFADLTQNKLANEHQIFTNLQIPKWIIAGKNDPSINLDYLRAVQQECNSSCDLVVLENCGHYPTYEKPKEFMEILNSIANKVF